MSYNVYITTFGAFTIRYNEFQISELNNRSKKVWALLEYLIVNHGQKIPTSTIIDLLWPEGTKSSAPENALKICLHRVRELLDQLHCPCHNIIINKRNTLYLAPEINFILDIEQLEENCQKATDESASTSNRIEAFQNIVKNYKGDFLSSAIEFDWTVPIRLYYHNLYINTCYSILKYLIEQEYYEDVIHYAYEIIKIDEYDETIHYHLIYSLYKTDKQQAALAQYDHIVKVLYDDFGVNPSIELTSLYKEIINVNHSTVTDLSLIRDSLKESVNEPHAYECEYSIFRHIYQIQARSMSRTGLSFFLCLLSLDICSKSKSKINLLSQGMDRLKDVLRLSLRCSDTFARYSPNQYIVLLPSTSYENGVMIADRLLRAFDSRKPKLSVAISFKLKSMEPVNQEKKM